MGNENLGDILEQLKRGGAIDSVGHHLQISDSRAPEPGKSRHQARERREDSLHFTKDFARWLRADDTWKMYLGSTDPAATSFEEHRVSQAAQDYLSDCTGSRRYLRKERMRKFREKYRDYTLRYTFEQWETLFRISVDDSIRYDEESRARGRSW